MSSSPTTPRSARTISLISSDDGVIENVNLYPGRAELTRIFRVIVEEGENHVDIHGLPISLVDDSLRVEGHGRATICDVVVSQEDPETIAALTSTPAHVDDLKRRRKELSMRLSATQHSRKTLGTYLDTIKADQTSFSSLRGIFQEHDKIAAELDSRILDLETEISNSDKSLDAERNRPETQNAKNLSRKISIAVLGHKAGKVKFSVKYLVQGANWTPIYEIQADTQRKDKPLTLVYKALITQSTYEFWKNASLTLETVTPSLSMNPPRISSWHLWVRDPSERRMPRRGPSPQAIVIPSAMVQTRYSPRARSISRSRSRSPRRHRRSRSPPPRMQHLQVTATDNGGVMATFKVPGVVNLPSDAQQHSMTVAQLSLQADFIWYAIPSKDTRVYIKAKIKNNSDYRLIPGMAKMYVDGSFASTGRMPPVSSQDVFDLPLGIDPGVKITYHTREKKAAQSGIYSRSTNNAFTQRISIHNAKSIPITNLKVTDCIPISTDQRVEVRLISPALTLPVATSTSEKTSTSILKLKPSKSVSDTVKVAPNVTANWDGFGEEDVDQKALGKDGIVCWFVSLAPQERVVLILHYEISHSEGLIVDGYPVESDSPSTFDLLAYN